MFIEMRILIIAFAGFMLLSTSGRSVEGSAGGGDVIVPHKGIGSLVLGQRMESSETPEMMVMAGAGGKVFCVLTKHPKFKLKKTQISVGSTRKSLESHFGVGAVNSDLTAKIGGGSDVIHYDGFFVTYKEGVVEMIGVANSKSSK